MSTIPELAAACEINDRMRSRRLEATEDAKSRRALWLRAVAKGATRSQIIEHCGVSPSVLESELRKARDETTDPKLKVSKGPNRGATPGRYPCPEAGCEHAEGGTGKPFGSAQGLGMHRMRVHGHRVGGKLAAAAN